MTERVAEQIDHQLLQEYYKKMLELRVFEVKVQELYRNGMLPGFVHLYVGEEAVAVGVCSNLEAADLVFSTHRGHGHALAKGVPAGVVLAELWGKVTGSSGGRGGSMHMYAPEYGFMGTNGIVGVPIPLATGGALSAKLRKKGQVVVSFFGEGAVNSRFVPRSGQLWRRVGLARRICMREQPVRHGDGVQPRHQEHQRGESRRCLLSSRGGGGRTGCNGGP